MAENVIPGAATVPVSPGTAGLQTQAPGAASTVSNLANASGGVGAGNLVEKDIDEQLARFQSEDTALMTLMLKARKVKVASPEVEHYMIDEQRAVLTVSEEVRAGSSQQFVLPLEAKDQNIPRDYHTLLVKGVSGYNEAGNAKTPGKNLMVFVVGRDSTTNNPIVRAVNGPKTNPSDQWCTTPRIAANTKVVLMANAMYETQKEVDPDLIVPQPTTVYLQKRGMNQIVSDYFEAQKKRIPFSQKVIAEQAVLNFKRAGNRTLWIGRKGKMMVRTPKTGDQMVYFTEGVRWQFKKELQHTGKWTFEDMIALTKMFYTGEDVPKSAILLAGKNLIEELQCIDFSNHPEISIAPFQYPNSGWTVTRVTTIFGTIDIKREPTLDTLGLSNSGALIGEDRLVHYTYSQEHEFNDRVEGEEASRKGVLVWDALALKGACHIWIDGEGKRNGNTASSGDLNSGFELDPIVDPGGMVRFSIWNEATAPSEPTDNMVYYLLQDCPGIDTDAQSGQMWRAKVNAPTYKPKTSEEIGSATFYTKLENKYVKCENLLEFAEGAIYYVVDAPQSTTWTPYTGELVATSE